ncbi:MAG: toll/interleukin-1 receptor domain-containing protein [Bacteroidales bacterium]|nr:toll/interleukin-1 receptor domain-containing protein [Bacteroidales bacterium]
MAYDIFISYRRKGAGAGVAGELQAKLENMGYKVFLDVDKIGSGQFPAQIEKAIEECKDFLLVLSPGTLDRCVDEEDWVRREIIQAQNQNKNIIGVGLPGFIMPEANMLPAPLEPVSTIQVFSWTHEYRTASFAKIEENLVSSLLRKKKIRQKRLMFIAIALVALVTIVLLLPKKPAVQSEEPPALSNDVVPEYQMFDFHAKKTMNLTSNLPSIAEFRENFLQLVSNKEPFMRLMEGIAECDSAVMLKNKYGDRVIDSYNIEDQQTKLLNLRKDYMNAIMDDVKVLLDEDGAMFAHQDMEIAGILALPDEKPLLDSIETVIKQRLAD